MHHTQGVWGSGTFFVYGGLRLRNRAVNNQRRGIITAMVSCLFALQNGYLLSGDPQPDAVLLHRQRRICGARQPAKR